MGLKRIKRKKKKPQPNKQQRVFERDASLDALEE